ncbi:MAG TPA: UbiH/UbiF family hydroxylase [Hyphomicrobium sp.]|uniref:UbiH/UbiF family hydroxylase n=1 Tax=Hyphomicrobium sp. TaxID=82 RepID=UPI002CF0CDF1|nr:UbiH/UbiF family hydroxylase [Hyphomicrobium sp.]HRN88609.1 UbiH/UbiF family hydroxylase [Hyphomicrobium sp.]
MNTHFTAAVVGAGPAGLATALSLGAAGCDVLLAAPPHRAHGGTPDNRTAALFAGSIALLQNLDAWEKIASHSAPIKGIRIIDDTGGLLRAPELVFTAAEIGLDAFGWNVPNSVLTAGLVEVAERAGSRIRLHSTAGIVNVEIGATAVNLTTHEGETFTAGLVVGADGRGSLCRQAAGIGTRSWTYAQSAIATSFQHGRPHHDLSTEFHRPAGPFTTVPLKGLASSLVWVERPDEAQRLAALDEPAFRAVLEERLTGLLGPVGEITSRAVFPLSGLTAEAFGRNRVALVGEAGHVIPPIGAQGLNLGLRDAATLADCVADARAAGQDVGGRAMLDAYSARRRVDVTSRIATVDVLNRSLISTLGPVHLARGLGLIALKTLGPLRRIAVREGLDPASADADLLHPDGARRLSERASGGARHSAA